MADNSFVTSYRLVAKSTDPVYIGTGGYTIGRVDNTIVRDPSTRIPKIPGTSVAGTWRYFMALELQSWFKEEEEDGVKYRSNRESRNQKDMRDLTNPEPPGWVLGLKGNCWSGIKCAGQDDIPNETYQQARDLSKNSHCGRCIICKSFGYAKNNKAEQGLLSFTDLNILFFPVYTRFGPKWITSKRTLDEARLDNSVSSEGSVVLVEEKTEKHGESINLGG